MGAEKNAKNSPPIWLMPWHWPWYAWGWIIAFGAVLWMGFLLVILA